MALQSLPVARNAPIGPGSVQGALATTLFTKPVDIAIQVTTPFANGAKINGMINCGFNTIGVPKIKGSLMLHTAGINAVLPRDLPYADFERQISKIANPIVAPEPPIHYKPLIEWFSCNIRDCRTVPKCSSIFF